jgi:hypothetical protein
MSLVAIPVGVDHRDFQAVDEADGVDPDFAVIETVVHSLDGRPLENSLGVLEGDLASFDVLRFFAASQVYRIDCIYIM